MEKKNICTLHKVGRGVQTYPVVGIILPTPSLPVRLRPDRSKAVSYGRTDTQRDCDRRKPLRQYTGEAVMRSPLLGESTKKKAVNTNIRAWRRLFIYNLPRFCCTFAVAAVSQFIEILWKKPFARYTQQPWTQKSFFLPYSQTLGQINLKNKCALFFFNTLPQRAKISSMFVCFIVAS